MRLYLSSYQLGRRPEAFSALVADFDLRDSRPHDVEAAFRPSALQRNRVHQRLTETDRGDHQTHRRG